MSLLIKTENSWALSGELVFSTINHLDKQIDKQLTQKEPSQTLMIDLHNTTKVDSAGIALLLKISHFCHIKSINLSINGLKLENAKALIKIYNLENILTY